MKYSINTQRKHSELQNKLYQCVPGIKYVYLYTGQSFSCFVEFFVCEYAGCNQSATGNCLNGKYSQRLADVIQNNDFDFDKPIVVHICHSKCFPVAG